MKILLLEDDYALHMAIKESIELEGHSVTSYFDGLNAYEEISSIFDLFILDINVPNINGIEILTHIKQRYKSAYVIIISASIDIVSIKKAYKEKCDDYIKKPFYIEELLYKICNLDSTTSYEILKDGFYYNIDNRTLLNKDNKIVSLTKKENLLLLLLLNNKNNIVTHNQIINYVYEDKVPLESSIRSLMRRLREKLPEGTINTLSGQGYCIESKLDI